VIGDKPRPTANEKKISHDRIIKGTKDHVLNLVIDETNLVNYDGLVRQLECNGQFSLWYDSGDTKYMNGGNDGIDASIGFDDVITASTSDDEQFIGEAKWSSKFTPERELNPIAA
jgi:hypothetical protein